MVVRFHQKWKGQQTCSLGPYNQHLTIYSRCGAYQTCNLSRFDRSVSALAGFNPVMPVVTECVATLHKWVGALNTPASCQTVGCFIHLSYLQSANLLRSAAYRPFM
jgi:hypothetical protein